MVKLLPHRCLTPARGVVDAASGEDWLTYLYRAGSTPGAPTGIVVRPASTSVVLGCGE